MAENPAFSSLTSAWLAGDHYKWRAMRANGIPEDYITGETSDWEKFEKWAETVPFTMRNPLYHWTHMELKRYFGIEDLLNSKTAKSIYREANEMLQKPEYRPMGLLKKMKVEILCTTDDPVDKLEYHKQMQGAETEIKVLPAFRPDNYILIQQEDYLKGIKKLEAAADTSIQSFEELIQALYQRVDFFHKMGGRISDHGLEQIYAVDFSEFEVDRIFKRKLEGHAIFPAEALQFQSAVLYYLALKYHEKNWVMQFHLGALRNNNTRLIEAIGGDSGGDSMGDFAQAKAISRFLNRLDLENSLPKTILYNLNPANNEVFATMCGNFNDGKIVGKMQWGSGWWFLDQKDGMEKQINTLSNMGLLSRFVGMLTDSRSFLSFPRHEYFRRILCNLIGADIEDGELPADLDFLGQMVEDICYNNAKKYFNL